MQSELINLRLLFWHPLKGPCQEKTPLHRKIMMSFFCRVRSSSEEDPFCYLLPCFQMFWFGSLTDLQPGTHQDQGHFRKIKLVVA
jgi:hypothetical protein